MKRNILAGPRSARIPILLVCCLALLLGLVAGLSAGELRGVWADGWSAGFHSQSEVDQLLGKVGDPNSLGDIRQANCNAVFVQVRRRADVCYPSGMGEPYMSGLSPSTFNALQAIINAAHDTTGGKQRVEVYCWIVTFATSTNSNSIYYKHNDPSNPDQYWVTLDDTGAETDDKALDPGHPKCEQYLTDVCMDLINRFDIDGLHFDYIRFTGSTQGYNPTSVARYNTWNAKTGQPATSDETFKQWRRDQVTAFVRKVYANMLLSKPQCKLSAALVTWTPSPANSSRSSFQGTRPYYDVYSDWDSWLQEGILDMGVPMNYFDWSSRPTDYTKWINFEKDRKFNRSYVIGAGTYLNTSSDAITELLKTRDASPSGNYAAGYCIYDYKLPYEGGTWAAFEPSLVASVNSAQAAVPDMPWKSSPTLGHVCGTVTCKSDGTWADGATVTINGPTNRGMRADGTGFYAFIDLPPGTYVVTARQGSTLKATYTINVSAGVMTRKDLAVGDTTPTTISGIQLSNVTISSAVVKWNTDQPATGQVEYGTSTAYGSKSVLVPTLLSSHSIGISGLSANTLYHFRVISGNDNGDTVSGDQTFYTSGPPAISNVQVSSVGASSAVVTWDTNAPATSQVRFGTSSAYGSETVEDSALTTSHSVTVTGLQAETTYHCQAVSTNGYGSAASGDVSFTTAGAPKISGVAVSSIGWNSATISWITDVAADSQVEYGTTSSYGQTTTLDSNQVTSHQVQLSGLSQGTQYHFRVRSADGGGAGYSGDQTFTTSPFSGDVVVDDTDSGCSILSGSWTTGTTYSHYGSDYIWASGVSGTSESFATARVRWTPQLPVSGQWDIYVYYARGANRSTQSYWKITGAGAPQVVLLNQQINGNGWTLLASGVSMLSDSGGYVELSNNVGDSTKIVQGDAVKFTYVGGDVQAPTVPGNVTASALSESSVQVTWTASTDDHAVEGYHVYRDGTLVGSTPATTYTDASGLAASTTYNYQVSAYDGSGNESALSTPPAQAATDAAAASVSSIVEAKGLQDGVYVALPARPVTAAFSGFFYLEDPSRICGIRVVSGTAVTPGLSAVVTGKLALLDGCERALTDCQQVAPDATPAGSLALFVRQADLGGGSFNEYTPGITGGVGLNTVGLLVKVAGRVTGLAADGFYFDDGAGLSDGGSTTGVWVWTGQTPSVALNDWVCVTGISSCRSGSKVAPTILATSVDKLF